MQIHMQIQIQASTQDPATDLLLSLFNGLEVLIVSNHSRALQIQRHMQKHLRIQIQMRIQIQIQIHMQIQMQVQMQTQTLMEQQMLDARHLMRDIRQ